jgi:hypothetical protein
VAPETRGEARPIEPRRAVSTRFMKLETAKEILAEVFHARPSDAEEMIQKRLEKMNWPKARTLRPCSDMRHREGFIS